MLLVVCCQISTPICETLSSIGASQAQRTFLFSRDTRMLLL